MNHRGFAYLSIDRILADSRPSLNKAAREWLLCSFLNHVMAFHLKFSLVASPLYINLRQQCISLSIFHSHPNNIIEKMQIVLRLYCVSYGRESRRSVWEKKKKKFKTGFANYPHSAIQSIDIVIHACIHTYIYLYIHLRDVFKEDKNKKKENWKKNRREKKKMGPAESQESQLESRSTACLSQPKSQRWP